MSGGCAVRSSDNHYSVMDRIMLRFRPIAPKPAAGEDAPAAPEQEKGNGAVKRTKRKYVRVRAREITKKKTRKNGRSEKGAVTLQLLPERSETEKTCCNSTALKSQQSDQHKVDADSGGTAALVNVRSVTKTWIVVESVTETYAQSGLGLGFSDGEKIRNLQADTCPGFVSDGANNVVWVNEAYRELVAAENGLMVWLVVKERMPYFAPAFACSVRMIQQTKHGHKWNRIVPCDVWKMEFPGFAWKLDLKTALGLRI